MSNSKLRTMIDLFLISAISLYFELLIIRWLSSEIRIFAYFKNMPLMAALFGLGLGLALSNSKRDLKRWFPVALLVLTSIICFAAPLKLVHVTFINPAEHYLIGDASDYFGSTKSFLEKLAVIIPGLVVIVSVFYLIVFTFTCLGQCLGQLFDRFKPLMSYTINVGASLVGIGCFTLLSWLSLKPTIWLTLGVLPCFWFYRRPWQIMLLLASVVLAFLTSQPNLIWSPYYRLSVVEAVVPGDAQTKPFWYGYTVKVNYDTMEGAYDNSPAHLAMASPAQRKDLMDYYDTLYDVIGEKPRSILVLAGGVGNDLAAAIRHGANDIDALEIDPEIVRLGRKIHPEKPYDNPAVHVTIDDARAFLRRTNKKYDLVDYAYLDSHNAFSSMSSIRLDNYIYTVESFRDAAKLLKPDGVMSVTFYSTAAWQQARLFKTITEALGQEPFGVYSPNNKALTFLIGGGVNRKRIEASGLKQFDKQEIADQMVPEMMDWKNITVTTDDWPFLFLRQRAMTLPYAAGLIFTLCIGWRLVGRCFGNYMTDALGRTMFFLGAGFMLIEVKSVSQMGLLAGTTWIVNAIVIAAILMMILLANACQYKLQLKNVKVLYALLFATLLTSYFLPMDLLQSLPIFARLAIGGLTLSLPIFIASNIFALTFKDVTVPHKALGMNLLGTLFGGALEYLSMIFGISALNLVAIGLYGLALYYSQRVTTKNEIILD